MAFPALTLVVKGADHPNLKPRIRGAINRRFEIEMCRPGEPVHLELEPENPVDPAAIRIMSERGIQLGYVSAERNGLVGARMRAGADIRAVFQQATKEGALIRIGFDGEPPDLPPPVARNASQPPDDEHLYSDPVWPDDHSQ